MNIVISLIIFLAFLIVYTIVSTIIKLALFLTTRTKYENIRLFIPVILTLIVWGLLIFFCIRTINNYIEKDIFSEIIKLYLTKQSFIPLAKPCLIIFAIFTFIGIIIQTFTFFAVNIPLEKLFSNIRFAIKKVFKLNGKETDNNVSVKEYVNKLNIGSAFLASMFCTILILFSIIVFVLIGLYLANKVSI